MDRKLCKNLSGTITLEMLVCVDFYFFFSKNILKTTPLEKKNYHSKLKHFCDSEDNNKIKLQISELIKACKTTYLLHDPF